MRRAAHQRPGKGRQRPEQCLSSPGFMLRQGDGCSARGNAPGVSGLCFLAIVNDEYGVVRIAALFAYQLASRWCLGMVGELPP